MFPTKYAGAAAARLDYIYRNLLRARSKVCAYYVKQGIQKFSDNYNIIHIYI